MSESTTNTPTGAGAVDGDHPPSRGNGTGPGARALDAKVSNRDEDGWYPPRTPTVRARPMAGAMVLSYLLGVLSLGGLVVAAGTWDVLANTRVLSGLIAAGVIPLGEDDPGFGAGVPAVDLFIRSQEPVSWPLVLLAAALFLVVAGLKGLQFHRIASFVGIEGTLGQHLRAFFYGHGVGRLTPCRIGEVAWVSALRGQGSSVVQGARVVYLLKGFLLFEIASFALVGLFLNGVFTWAASLTLPLLILAGCYLFVRPTRSATPARQGPGSFRSALSELTREPRMLAELAALSLVSFLLIEVASYIVPMAFSTVTVPLIQNELRIIVVSAPLIILAVVGGYIARLVPVTPGGIGQFEWGFALVLTVGGLPFSTAAVLALLVGAVRYASGALLFAGTMLTRGVETNLREVLGLYRRPPSRPAVPEPRS